MPNICAELRVPVEVSTPLLRAVNEAILVFDAALTRHWTRQVPY